MQVSRRFAVVLAADHRRRGGSVSRSRTPQVPDSLARTLDVTGYKGLALRRLDLLRRRQQDAPIIEVERINGSDTRGAAHRRRQLAGVELRRSRAACRPTVPSSAAPRRSLASVTSATSPRWSRASAVRCRSPPSRRTRAPQRQQRTAGDDGRAHVVARTGDDGEITVETSDGSAAGFTSHVNAQIAPGRRTLPRPPRRRRPQGRRHPQPAPPPRRRRPV